MRLFILFLLAACSSSQTELDEGRSRLLHSSCGEAASYYEKLAKKEILLSTLGFSQVKACEKKWGEAGKKLEEARKYFYSLDETNVTEEVLANSLLNDTAKTYKGELYEQIYLRVIRSLYFIAEKQFRQASNDLRANHELLKLLSEKFSFKKDVLVAKVLAALTHEILYLETKAGHELNPARVSWELALKEACDRGDTNLAKTFAGILKDYENAFKVPVKLACEKDVPALGFWTDPKKGVTLEIVTKQFVPPKQQKSIPIPMPSLFLFLGSQGKYNAILNEPPLEVKVPEINLDSAPSLDGLTYFGDLGTLAHEELERTSTSRGLRTASRVALKFLSMKVASKAAQDNDNAGLKILGILGDITSSMVVNATEKADLRSWDTVPRFFYFKRFKNDQKGVNVSYRHQD